jgi:anti-sigma B factor antagonist
MALSIDLRESGNVIIVDMSGRLWVLEPPLRQRMFGLVEQGRRSFVLNLARLNYIDSSGLGQLISIWTTIRSKDGHIVLLNPNVRVQRLFEITKLNSVFEIFFNEDEALRAAGKTGKSIPSIESHA